MAYTSVPSVVTGQTYLASDYNTYVKDNMTALWPYTTAGDLAYATGSNALTRLGLGSNSQVLTVDSGVPKWKTPSSGISLADVYPVGCIYTTTVATNPATVFGFGTWVATGEGRVLVGNGSSDAAYAAGATGGESNHTLTSTEMPSHTHTNTAHTHTFASWHVPLGPDDGSYGFINIPAAGGATYTTNSKSITIANTGSNGAHNNMPPYLVVYFWKRTA